MAQIYGTPSHFHCLFSHSRTGRMQAKGCAKPMTWKNARRYFYWNLRGRLAREQALLEISRANPSLPYDALSNLLDGLLSECSEPQALAEKLEKLDLESTIAQLKNDYVAQQITALASQDRRALISGVANLFGNLNEDERATILIALHSTRSNGEILFYKTMLD
jgi:acetyl-CoA carboxylase / biotin carboxylase 1